MATTATLRVNNRTPKVKGQGDQFCREFVEILGDETRKLAQANVAPGKGPGPHPHRPGWEHEDTGALAGSITSEVSQRGYRFEAAVSSNLDYGMFLEMGWTTKAGNHYRYPWLYPAAVAASKAWEGIGKSTSARTFTGDSGGGAIESPLSATLLPEAG